MRGLLIEPFYTGSHRQLVDTLLTELPGSILVTLPGTKWHWRARTGALSLASRVGSVLDDPLNQIDNPGNAAPSAIQQAELSFMFCSSTLNLCELVGLCPRLAGLRKILYFHENQLIYPVRVQKQRDYQYGYNQVLSCLVADEIWFNSKFNMDSFYSGISPFLNIIPHPRPTCDMEKLRQKSRVVFYPMQIDCEILNSKTRSPESRPLRILWPHRWEHDKNPDDFFSVLFELFSDGATFELFILGEHTNAVPPIFEEANEKLCSSIRQFGYVSSKREYWEILKSVDVVVSTANHEFFGVAMLEAVACGAFPLCPKRLVYPEIYPAVCLYRSIVELKKRLQEFINQPSICRRARDHISIDFHRFSTAAFMQNFSDLNARINSTQYRTDKIKTLI